ASVRAQDGSVTLRGPISPIAVARRARACPTPVNSVVSVAPELYPHHMLSTARASSDIGLGSHGGSNTMWTLPARTPATLATAFSTMIGSSCAEGQLGVVSVMSTVSARSAAIALLATRAASWMPAGC